MIQLQVRLTLFVLMCSTGCHTDIRNLRVKLLWMCKFRFSRWIIFSYYIFARNCQRPGGRGGGYFTGKKEERKEEILHNKRGKTVIKIIWLGHELLLLGMFSMEGARRLGEGGLVSWWRCKIYTAWTVWTDFVFRSGPLLPGRVRELANLHLCPAPRASSGSAWTRYKVCTVFSVSV